MTWGYTSEWLAAAGCTDRAVADELLAIACGGGCPLALGWPPSPGSTVIDLGCGGGHDVVLAAMLVQGRPGARVVGVDMSPAMLERTAAVAAKAGVARRRAHRPGANRRAACRRRRQHR